MSNTKVKSEQMDNAMLSGKGAILCDVEKGNNGLFHHFTISLRFKCSKCKLGENIKVQRGKVGTVKVWTVRWTINFCASEYYTIIYINIIYIIIYMNYHYIQQYQ